MVWPVKGCVVVGAGDEGVGGFKASDLLVGEGSAEGAGGAEDGVAFRHGLAVQAGPALREG